MSTLFTSDASPILPEQVANDLLIAPLMETAVATNPAIARTVVTGNNTIRFPRVSKHASAGWVAEGSPIPETGVELADLVVEPRKLGALSSLTRETMEDSDPAAQQILGESMVRGIRQVLDTSFVSSTGAGPVEPKGLAGITATEAVLDLADLDSFVQAAYTIAEQGHICTGYLVSPADAAAIALLKQGSDSNAYLLESNAPGTVSLNGIPLVISADLEPGTAYAIPAATVLTVIRRDATIETSDAPRFSSDVITVKTTMRVGFGFADELAIVRLTAA